MAAKPTRQGVQRHGLGVFFVPSRGGQRQHGCKGVLERAVGERALNGMALCLLEEFKENLSRCWISLPGCPDGRTGISRSCGSFTTNVLHIQDTLATTSNNSVLEPPLLLYLGYYYAPMYVQSQGAYAARNKYIHGRYSLHV